MMMSITWHHFRGRMAVQRQSPQEPAFQGVVLSGSHRGALMVKIPEPYLLVRWKCGALDFWRRARFYFSSPFVRMRGSKKNPLVSFTHSDSTSKWWWHSASWSRETEEQNLSTENISLLTWLIARVYTENNEIILSVLPRVLENNRVAWYFMPCIEQDPFQLFTRLECSDP